MNALDVVGNYASLLLTVPDFVPGLSKSSTEVLAEALVNTRQPSTGLGGGAGGITVRPTFLAQVLDKVIMNDEEQLPDVVGPVFDAILQKLKPVPSKVGAPAMTSTKALLTLLAHKSTVSSSSSSSSSPLRSQCIYSIRNDLLNRTPFRKLNYACAQSAVFTNRADFFVTDVAPPAAPIIPFFAQFQPPTGRTGRNVEHNTALGLVRFSCKR